MSGAWGSGTWGSGSWGGGVDFGPVDAASVAIRENVIRMEFDGFVFLTGLLEPEDASWPYKWTVTENAETIGLTGDAARPVRVVRVELAGADSGVAEGDFGRFVNLILDRPLTAWPAQYSVAWQGIHDVNLANESAGSSTFQATYRRVEPPNVDSPRRAKDFANPQSIAAARTSLPNPTGFAVLGSFGYGDDGDYAVDDGIVSLRKRCLRRVTTRKNGFVHLPGYGVGIPLVAKQTGSSSLLASLRADAEAQLLEEPDVAKARVQVIRSADQPDLVRFRIAVKPKIGPAFAFDAPFALDGA